MYLIRKTEHGRGVVPAARDTPPSGRFVHDVAVKENIRKNGRSHPQNNILEAADTFPRSRII